MVQIIRRNAARLRPTALTFMQEITRFTLESHSGEYVTWPLKTTLLADLQPTATNIPGYVIERQYQIDERYLIITSWDCPFEEANDFELLDKNYAVLAHKRLGVPYGSFLLDDASVVDEQTLLLKYFENDYWTLTVRKQRPLRLFTSYLSLKRRR